MIKSLLWQSGTSQYQMWPESAVFLNVQLVGGILLG